MTISNPLGVRKRWLYMALPDHVDADRAGLADDSPLLMLLVLTAGLVS
jgi:hypothetical protein